MQHENKNINQPDSFSENIRRKLENHEVPVDASLWDVIESRVAGRKKKVIPFWLWISGGAAVATLALLISLPFLFRQDKVYVEKTFQNTIPQETSRNVIADNRQQTGAAGLQQKNMDETAREEMPVKQSRSRKRAISIETDNDKIPVVKVQAEPVATNDKSYGNEKENLLVVNLSSEDSLVARVDESTTGQHVPESKKRYIPDTLIEEPENVPDLKQKKRNDWQLAASMGMGNNNSLSTSNDFIYADYRNKGLSEATTNYTRIMTPNEFSSQNYRIPVSFGLVFRKNLSNSVGIESGLMYTYLSTTFEQQATFVSSDAELMLHYLGVPLNLVVKLWSNPNWEIYLSGGVMGEKGLRSIYVQNQHIGNNQTITTTAKTNIDGLQWSLNGAMGTTYKLQRNIGIYFEPKFGYFFDNDQPVSARTGAPFVLGLTGGLIFQF